MELHRAQGSILKLWEKKGLSGTWACMDLPGILPGSRWLEHSGPSPGQLFRVSARKCLEAMPRSLAASVEGTAELSRAEA